MRRISVLALVSVFLIACSRSPHAVSSQQDAVPVRVREAHRTERTIPIVASGSVEARDSIELGFKVAGRIGQVLVEEGDRVRPGQLLARLEDSDYQHGTEAASAQVSAARANFDKAQAGARQEEVEQARVAFARAEDEYQRMRQLYERKSLAANDFRKFEAAYLIARERYDEARRGARVEDKRAAEALLEQARAQESVARERLADTRLAAPIGGLVARRLVDRGEMVAAGMPAFSIMDLNPARVRIGVPEADIGRMRIGQRATVLIPSLAGRSFEGRVTQVGIAAEPVSRTFAVKIDVPNPDILLRAGMIAEARIQTDALAQVLTVPVESVVRDPQGATLVYVYFPSQKRVFARRVELATFRGTEVEIRHGLAGNELIVVAGQQKLRDGTLVDVSEGTR